MSQSKTCFLCGNKRTKSEPTLFIRTIASLDQGAWRQWETPANWSASCTVCALWMESTGVVKIERKGITE